MSLRLVPGQNAPLAQRVLSFAVTGQAEPAQLDVLAIILAENLSAASSDDLVFYNQPDAAGVHLRDDAVHIDLDGLPVHAQAVLCAFAFDSATVRSRQTVTAILRDPHGAVLAEFPVPWDDAQGAVICFELYQRADMWKVRAVGQGYAGGLAQLLGAHGIEVDDSDGTAAPIQERPAGFVEPLDRDHPLERIAMIFEDAARSTAALLSARDYAALRLDEELSAAVADLAARTGPAADLARAVAQRRHDELIGDAHRRYDADARQLIGELDVIDHQLPPALASWQSSSWQSAPSAMGTSDGIRLGQVCAAETDRLILPFCSSLPLQRPLWVDTASSAAGAPVVSALVMRLLAATPVPRPILDVVDLTGAFEVLTSRLGGLMGGEVVRSHLEVSEKLATLVRAVDLAALRAESGLNPVDVPARVVVLSDFGHGLQRGDLTQVAMLASKGAAARVSLVIVGADESESAEPLLQSIYRFCEHLPVDADARIRDPWTGREWLFTPDSLPADGELLAQFIRALAAR